VGWPQTPSKKNKNEKGGETQNKKPIERKLQKEKNPLFKAEKGKGGSRKRTPDEYRHKGERQKSQVEGNTELAIQKQQHLQNRKEERRREVGKRRTSIK